MPERITILHLRASNFVGGPEKQILEHCSRLDAKRFKPLLCTYVADGKVDYLGDAGRRMGIESSAQPALSPLNPGAVLNLVRLIRRENVAMICSHGYKPNILGTLAARFTGIGTVAVSRGWTGENPKIRFYEALDRFFLRHADHIVAVSEGQRRKILDARVNPLRVSVIHNAINLDKQEGSGSPRFREKAGIPQDAVLIASAGRLSPEKNYFGMIEAARMALERNSKLYFVIFGEGELRSQLEERIRHHKLSGRFLLPGFRNDLLNLLPEIDIFMLPSFTEGLPNVVLEAFAARKPVVATAVGGTPEVVQHEVSGFLSRPDDVDSMADQLLRLAESEELRNQMGEAGYRHVAEYFSFSEQSRKYEQLYESLYYRRHACAQ